MLTPQEHLALIDGVIAKRLRGDAYETYSEAESSFGGCSIRDLYDIRDRLRQEAAATSGANFHLLEPFDS